MTDALPEALMRYLRVRDTQRAEAVASVLESLTERELRLIKDAAVMGYVRGKMSSRTEPIRNNSAILAEVIDACLAAADLYPAITAEPPVEAQPPYHRWYVETRDGVADQWAPGERFTDRAEAVERYRSVSVNFPTWKDGTPVERRFVRETTTYTVEELNEAHPDSEDA